MTLFLVQNGVLSTRPSTRSGELTQVSRKGIRVLADRFSLRQRGIEPRALAEGVEGADLDVVIDSLAAGQKAIWFQEERHGEPHVPDHGRAVRERAHGDPLRLVDAALKKGHDVAVFAYEGAVSLTFARQAAHANAVHGRDVAQEDHPLPRTGWRPC